jgi:hypothetical protein
VTARARRARARRASALLALAASLAATALPARSAAAQPPAAAGWPARLAAATRAALDAVADSARAGGVPVEPLQAKAQEGVLKGADDGRIVGAVRRLAAELTAARAALGGDASASELVAGASALHAGVPWAALRELAATRAGRRRGGTLAMLLVVAGDLVVRGVPPELAAQTLTTLAARGVGEGELVALRREVDRDIQGGIAPPAATAARARALALQLDERRTAPRP